eukprot:Pgem_evm1s1831
MYCYVLLVKVDKRVTGSKEVDEELNLVIEHVINDFVLSWYQQISENDEFPFEVRQIIQSILIKLSSVMKEVNFFNISIFNYTMLCFYGHLFVHSPLLLLFMFIFISCVSIYVYARKLALFILIFLPFVLLFKIVCYIAILLTCVRFALKFESLMFIFLF